MIWRFLPQNSDLLLPYPEHELQKIFFLFYFSNSFLDIVLPKGDFLVVWGFFGEKCWSNAKIPIFWGFLSQNVTFYRPTLVMMCEQIIMFCFYNSFVYIMLPKDDFLVVWEDLLGRNFDYIQNTYILTIFAPKCGHIWQPFEFEGPDC